MAKEKTITATEFKAKCLSLIDHLGVRGLIVTKRGLPVARVLPLNVSANEELIGSMKGKIKIKGDLLTTGANWAAESGHPHRRRATARRPEKA